MGEGVRAAFGLAGGLALFLFGMENMSRALQQAAGERMRPRRTQECNRCEDMRFLVFLLLQWLIFLLSYDPPYICFVTIQQLYFIVYKNARRL